MRRREFIAGLGGATVWPLAARAQGMERRPVVGFLSPTPLEVAQPYIAAVRTRLAELGYVEGRNYELAVRNAPLPNREEQYVFFFFAGEPFSYVLLVKTIQEVSELTKDTQRTYYNW